MMLRSFGRTLLRHLAVAGLVIPALALAAPGDLDPSFGSGGRATIDFTYTQPIDIRSATPMSGGTVVVGTSARPSNQGVSAKQLVIANIDSSGQVGSMWGQFDPPFDCEPVAIRPDPQAHVIVACATGSRLVLVRNYYGNSSSYYDEELGWAYPEGFDIRALAVQQDGKYLVAGSYTQAGVRRVFLHRYAGLAPDYAFGEAGRVSFGLPSANVEAHALAVGFNHTDPVIYVAGSASTAAAGTDMVVARLTEAGVLDATFGQGGFASADWQGADDAAYAVAAYNSGAVVAGRATQAGSGRFFAWRLTATGADDAAFGGTGKVAVEMPIASTGDSDARATQLVVDMAGSLLLLGPVTRLADGDVDFGLARLSANGYPDPGFGNCEAGVCGKAVLPSGTADVPLAVTEGGGMSIVVGRQGSIAGSDVVVTRQWYGQPDYSFGTNGRASIPMTVAPSANLFDVAHQADGRILALGEVDGRAKLVRFHSNGSPDTTFATNGVLDIPGADFDGMLALQSDGRIIVAGGYFPPKAWRVLPDGTFDPAWNGGSPASFASANNPRSVAIQSDGKVIASLVRDDHIVVSRLNANGSTDTTFGNAGEVSIALRPNAYSEDSTRLRVLPDGRILVGGGTRWQPVTGGNNYYTFTLIRMLPSGAIDTTWGTGGFATGDIGANQLASSWDFDVAADGKVMAVGVCRYPYSDTCLARFNADGTLDTAFGANGFIERDLGMTDGGRVLARDAAGRYLVASADLNSGDKVLRLLPDGQFDTTFSGDGIVAVGGGYFGGALLQPDGYFVIGQGGGPAFSLTRLEGGGTLEQTVLDTTIDFSPGANPTSSTGFTALLSSNVAGTTFECRLDAEAFAACGATVSRSGLADGAHTFEARAKDGAGNVDQTPASHTWVVDTVPPDTTIVDGPPPQTPNTWASFTYSTTEWGGGFECNLDAGGWTGCPWPMTYQNLAEGPHTIQMRSIDPAGNVDLTPATWSWTIDTVAPDTTVTSGPSGPVGSDSATFTFTSNEPAATFECRLDGASFVACASPFTASALAQGAHVFDVRARDSAGNIDASPASRAWSVDTAAPDTTLTSGPSGTVASGAATFAFTSNDASATFQCSLDGAPFETCASGVSYSGLADGMHMFEVRAVDALGNSDQTPAMRTWAVDTANPNATITSGPDAVTSLTVATLAFTSTEGGTFMCRLDAAAYETCTSPVNLEGLAAGSHAFSVYSVDAAGNADATPATWSWFIDTSAPETTVTSAPSGTVASASAVIAFSSPEAGMQFECSLDGGAFAACASPVSLSGLADGAHSFQVRAVDAAGNVDPTPASAAWTIDTTAPDTSITASPPAASNSTAATFSFNATEGATFECKLDVGDYAPCTSPKAYAGLGDGSHTFSVRARDGAGNQETSPASFSWTVDTVAPDTTIQDGPSGGNNAQPVTFTFSSTEGGTFECRMDSGSFEACTSPKAYSGLAKGQHTFRVRGIDAAGNVDASPATRSFGVK